MERALAAALLRLGIGLVFLVAGLEKTLRGPQATARLFEAMGIAWPDIVGPAIGYFELAGGTLLLLGLATRPVALLFAVEMLVAIVVVLLPMAAAAPSLADAFTVFRLEFVLVLGSTALALVGAGRWSADAVFARRRGRRDGRGAAVG